MGSLHCGPQAVGSCVDLRPVRTRHLGLGGLRVRSSGPLAFATWRLGADASFCRSGISVHVAARGAVSCQGMSSHGLRRCPAAFPPSVTDGVDDDLVADAPIVTPEPGLSGVVGRMERQERRPAADLRVRVKAILLAHDSSHAGPKCACRRSFELGLARSPGGRLLACSDSWHRCCQCWCRAQVGGW
jgi:hypothetical protein